MTLLDRRGGPSAPEAVGVCAQAAAILSMLAQSGVRLPDVSAQRFEVDDAGRLWLADVRGAVQAAPEDCERAHLELTRGLCRSVLAGPKVLLPPEELLESLDRAASTAEARRLLVAHG
jgi:hypothetical protein